MLAENNSPRANVDQPVYRNDNTEGFAQSEMDTLNQEFTHRWNHESAWLDLDLEEAISAFQTEGARR